MATTARGLRYPTSADDVRPYEDIAFLAADVNDEFDLVAGGVAGSISNGITAGSTTSASYVDMPAGSSKAFTKLNAAVSQLRVQFSASSFVTGAAATVCQYGIRVNGVDYDISRQYFNAVSDHRTCPAGVFYVTGLAAGAWTVQGRWKRTTGTGTLAVDSGDWISIDVSEVPA